MISTLYRIARPAFRLVDPETAHHLSILALKHGPLCGRSGPDDPILSTRVLGIDFPNPIGLAAGYDKDAEVMDAMLAMGFGFSEAGTVTPPSKVQVCSREYLPLAKSGPVRVQRMVAVCSDMSFAQFPAVTDAESTCAPESSCSSKITEMSARLRVELPRSLTAEEIADERRRQPTVGHHPVLDRVAEVDVLVHGGRRFNTRAKRRFQSVTRT